MILVIKVRGTLLLAIEEKTNNYYHILRVQVKSFKHSSLL